MAKDVWDKIWNAGERSMDKAYKTGEKRGIQAYKTGERIGKAIIDKWAASEAKRLNIPQKTVNAVFKRDKHVCRACKGPVVKRQKCKVCGRALGKLELDHIKPLNQFKKEALAISFTLKEPNSIRNFQTLCRHHGVNPFLGQSVNELLILSCYLL